MITNHFAKWDDPPSICNKSGSSEAKVKGNNSICFGHLQVIGSCDGSSLSPEVKDYQHNSPQFWMIKISYT